MNQSIRQYNKIIIVVTQVNKSGSRAFPPSPIIGTDNAKVTVPMIGRR